MLTNIPDEANNVNSDSEEEDLTNHFDVDSTYWSSTTESHFESTAALFNTALNSDADYQQSLKCDVIER